MTETIKPGVSETRNSPLRKVTAPLTSTIAKGIDKAVPWMPTEIINLAGNFMVTWASLKAAQRNELDPRGYRNESIKAAIIMSIGSGLDGIDGPHARERDKRLPGTVNFERGGIIDALGDRYQELSLAVSRAVSAHKRGDKIGKVLALTTAITNPLPSIVRAGAESLGIKVPESGKGLFGLIGTRPGRAALGTLATISPEVKGLPIQPALDTLMTVSNLKTAADRLAVIIKGTQQTLSSKTRDEAKTRLIALGIFGIAAAGTSLFTWHRLNRLAPKNKEQTLERDRYLEILSNIEQYFRQANLDHRIVGGTVTDFIGPNTSFRIDPETRTVKLINPNGTTLTRPDGTIKDIDVIIFSPNRYKFEEAKRDVRAWGESNGQPLPNISIEAARYPDWPERNKLKQFVTAFEYDKEGNPFLAFGSTKQEIRQNSLAPWTMNIDGISITILNPVAHALCYALRNPSGVKKKDKDRIGDTKHNKMGVVGRFAHQVLIAGREKGVDYKENYRGWLDYIHALRNNPDPLTGAKSRIIKLYWDTVGTSVSHGVGILHKLSTLSDRFTG